MKTFTGLQQTALQTVFEYELQKWIQGQGKAKQSDLKHRSGSYTLSEMQQSMSVQAT